MSQKLSITLIQSNLYWENIDANLNHLTQLIQSISETTDIIVLPEMFSTGFSMNTSLAEEMKGKSIAWLREIALEKGCVVCGSLMIKENDSFYNRFVWMNSNGTYQHYDKRHCFRMAKEHEFFTPGYKKLIINYKGFTICPLVCYDLRFPVWSRNKFVDNKFDYDILLYVANWPERREFAWQQLLIARAIENSCYVVGVNRVGVDGNAIPFSGRSAVRNYLGMEISSIPPHQDYVETIILDKEELDSFRVQFPAHMDADEFKIKD